MVSVFVSEAQFAIEVELLTFQGHSSIVASKTADFIREIIEAGRTKQGTSL